MYFYRDKGLFLQRLHPITTLLYTGVLLLLTVMYSHPLFLASLLLLVIWTAWELDGWKALKGYSQLAGMMVIFILIINPLLSREGQTILWHGPRIPGLGQLDVSLEAILFGLNMGLRMFLFIGIFCLYNLMMDPDRAMSMFSRFAQKSTITLALTIRLIPGMTSKAKQVGEIQRSRGVNLDTGGKLTRWRNRLPFLKIMLLSSLEDSWQTAEAMEARAFGSGSPTIYSRGFWRPRDRYILIGTLIALGIAIIAFFAGIGSYDFYPRLGEFLEHGEMPIMISVFSALAIPPALARGCKQWKYLRQKI